MATKKINVNRNKRRGVRQHILLKLPIIFKECLRKSREQKKLYWLYHLNLVTIANLIYSIPKEEYEYGQGYGYSFV